MKYLMQRQVDPNSTINLLLSWLAGYFLGLSRQLGVHALKQKQKQKKNKRNKKDKNNN